MSFRVVAEDPDFFKRFRVYESCCFCRKPTRFWVAKKDVACCEECASTYTLKQVPTKEEWCKNGQF